jgi:hypothetical protein
MLKKTVLLLLALVLSGCGVFSADPTLTPIFVTATPRIVFITETPEPGPTSVLAPTVPPDATQVAVNAESFDFETPQAPPASPTVITVTPTFTPTPTDTPITPGAPLFEPVGGVSVVQAAVDVGSCPTLPSGGFATIFTGDSNTAEQLACPIGPAANVASAYQTFERGIMVWVSAVGSGGQSGIFVLYNNNTFQRFADTWREGVDPSSTGLNPPRDGLREPIRGFGKVWRESGGVRDALGWATGNEQGGNGATQVFERGEMIFISQTGQTYVLSSGTPGTWTSVAVQY